MAVPEELKPISAFVPADDGEFCRRRSNGRRSSVSAPRIKFLSKHFSSHPRTGFVRGVLSAKVPDSSFAEAHRVLLSEPTHMEDEDEDQENEVEDERDCEECKVECRRESKRTTT